MTNEKYEITNIAHEQYPFLHRIRALRDIGGEVKAGDLGGFVEHEDNLSFEPEDDAWIFGDAIAAEDGIVNKGASVRDQAIVCGQGYVSEHSTVYGKARVEDSAYVRNAIVYESARVSGCGMVLGSADDPKQVPVLSGSCCVYGTVSGNVRLSDDTVVISGEEIRNDLQDTFVISGPWRSVIRDAARDDLKSARPAPQKKKARDRGRDR